MDKFQAMRVFVKIAEAGSLTAAANSLGKSLPSVVRMLAALEKDIQVRLFNRTTRHIALTEEGRFYLERCRRILADIEETEQVLNNEQVEPGGTVTLTAPVRFGEMHVMPAVTRFLQRYPQMQVKLILLDRIVNMMDEGIDLAVRIGPLNDSSHIAKPILEIRQVLCASPALIEQFGVPAHPEVLSELPCLLFTGISTRSLWHFEEKGKRFAVKVDGQLSCNQVAASVNACVAGLGFGYFYSYQVMPFVESGELLIMLEEYELPAQPVSLVYPHRELMSNKVRILIEWLSKELVL